ncbi:MAG: amino acid adenylation domain-containing protein, partial [Gammaproteobacteria bacterium]
PPDVPALRKALAAELPEYMVPSAFVVLDAFPLLPNGKVDRKALPQPEWSGDKEYAAPRSETEKQLARIWESVLKVEQVGLHDDFFELGGHSLLATQIVSRVRDTFGTAPELRVLFNEPTLAAFALEVEAQQRGDEQPAPPILPVPHFKGAPLSFAQQRLWFLDQLEGGNVAYNVPSAIRLKGQLDLDTLEAALNDLIARHESLRTIFGQDENGPVQIIAPELTLKLIRVDMSDTDAPDIAGELTNLAREAFDLARGPLLRLHTLRISAEDHIVALVIHHIISDAWSLNILFGELMTCYDARRMGEAPDLPALPVQFADFAIWQRNWLAGTELERQLDYWKTTLAGAPASITLPTDRPHPPVQTYNGTIISRTLSRELSTRLEALARQHNATLFMTLLAAFDVFLARYSGEDDIVVGTPIAGRNRSETEGLIGFFLNTLCLRADLTDNPSFSELLKQVSRNTLGAYAHQDLPFESLVEELKPPRDTSRPPLFQVLFTLQNAPPAAKTFDDLQLEGVLLNQNTAKFELSLGVQETPEGLLAGFEYNTDLFDRDTIVVMFDHFERLLEGIVANPACAVSNLPMLSDDEEQALITDRNATAQQYPPEETLHELFATQVRRRPDEEAVVCDGRSLSYAELNGLANELARRLSVLGAGPDTPVALGVERSLDMVIGVLGILKAGAAYVPLDPAYPADRIAYMLEDSGAPILVTQSALLEDMPAAGIETVCLDQLIESARADAEDLPDTGVSASDLAYIIYTSGSTGKPKGVQLEHRSVINFLTSMAKTPGFNKSDRLLAVTTLCFDISVLELLLPLTTGGTVVVATRDESVDGYALGELLHSAQITVMQATPATWRMLLQSDWQGSHGLKILCGGEALDRELARQLHEISAGVWNMYGPTETTIWSSCHLYKPTDSVISVGKPIANTQFYILDNQQRPVPAGVSGELYIGGDGVARGYRDRPELSSERFLVNPFRSGERMYRTGDLARFLKNGEVQVLGRTDFQVKLRGYRIELGEIEAAMQSRGDIKQAVVALREDSPGDQRLVGYLTTDEAANEFDTNALRQHLYETLPQYMVPSTYMILDEIPLTPNGKVNRKALPAPDWGAEQEYVAPETPLEKQLAEIWQAVLQIEKIGTQDNFFVLGGHSLLATQLVARIRHAMNIELPLMYIFDYPSIAALATAVEAFRLATETSGQDMDDDDLEDINI